MMSESDAEDNLNNKFIRSLFVTSQHNEDGDEDESEHSWICPHNPSISINYYLSIYAPGHGNRIWNSSACIAQHLLIPKLLTTIIDSNRGQCHPPISWPPKTCLEFGAGAALPSLALLHEGAHRVVLTDSARANTRTFDALHKSVHSNAKLWSISEEDISHRVMIVPHSWGEEIEDLRRMLGGEGRGGGGGSTSLADLVIASDCIYNPTHHASLLQSAAGVMSSDGLFIVGYSLHGNVPPDKILHFFHLAKHDFGLGIVNEFMKEYDGQEGIGSNDPTRGTVYVKVLARVMTSTVNDA